ncbi:MAG: proliferating cell nuclear antigen (pcna) [Candidatus Hadarchaeales archaeon]
MVNLVDEAAFKLTESGLKTRAMDPSRISLIDLDIPASAFSEYHVREPVVLGVKLSEMEKVVSRGKPDDEMVLELDQNASRMIVTFIGSSTRKLTMPLVDIGESELPDPKLQFQAAVEVLAGVIQDGIKDAEMVADKVRFEVKEDALIMTAEGDKGKTEFTLRKGDKGLLKISAKEQVRSSFNLKYLSDVLGEAGSGDTVIINLGEKMPIQLDFPVADGKGKLRFILAPVVESD